MKKNLFVALATLLFALPLAASTRPAPGQFGLKGEWIYFYPAIDDTYFALQGSTQGAGLVPQGEKFNNLWNYTSGYRVEGIYSFCNCINDLRLRWTQLLKKSHSTDVTGTSANRLYPTELPPSAIQNFPSPFIGSAGSEISMEYYAAEAMLGQLIYDCTPFSMEFEVGIQYAHVKLSEEVGYVIPAERVEPFLPARADFVEFEDTFNGIGPEMAFDADYALYNSDCYCPGTLYLTSSLRGALLIADSKAKFFSEDATGAGPLVPLYAATDNKSWRVVPWWDMKLGFDYTSNFNCFTASIEVGYEAGCYHKAISKERFVDSTAKGASFNHFQNFTYHGPYVALEVMF